MGAFGELLIQNWGGDLEAYRGNKRNCSNQSIDPPKNPEKIRIMNYRTASGKLTAQEMTSEHLINRLKYEINRLGTAKAILSRAEPSSKFNEILDKKRNNMPLETAEDVVNKIEDKCAPLVLEMALRRIPIEMYMGILSELLEKGKMISNSLDTPRDLFSTQIEDGHKG